MSTTTLLEALVDSPNALKIIEAANTIIAREQAERKKFYDIVHENCKAEYINGEIIFHSPVKLNHWRISMKLSSLLHLYVDKNNVGIIGVEKVMINLTRNDYEPDICFFSTEKAKHFAADQLLFPAPDLIIEILSKTTESYDRGIKWVDYAAHGIQEYWIVDPEKQFIEQYILENNKYALANTLTDQTTLICMAIDGLIVNWQEVFS